MPIVQALLVARKRHWILTSVSLHWPHFPVTDRNPLVLTNAPADATKCPAAQMGFRATGRPRYNFQNETVRSKYVWGPVFIRQILRRKDRLEPGRVRVERHHHRGCGGGALSHAEGNRLG